MTLFAFVGKGFSVVPEGEDVNVYASSHAIIIQQDEDRMVVKEVKIFDMLGNQIVSSDISQVSTKFRIEKSGVYIVKLILEENQIKTLKIIVN